VEARFAKARIELRTDSLVFYSVERWRGFETDGPEMRARSNSCPSEIRETRKGRPPHMLKHPLPAVVVVLLSAVACVTRNYQSEQPPGVVSSCIARGWRGAGASGYGVPISVEELENGYLVALALAAPPFSPVIFGLKHPRHSVWAEVTEAPQGSMTEYHRAFQITHARIDRVVVECQTPDRGPLPDVERRAEGQDDRAPGRPRS